MEPSSIIALKIPLQKCSSFLKKLANHLHTDSSLPSIIPDQNKTSRLVLLKKTISSQDLKGLPEELKHWITDQKDVSVVDYDPNEEIFKKPILKKNKSILIEADPLAEIIPPEVDSNIKKEILKHIMILNLEDEQLPYKKQIGDIFLEKNEGDIKTIVNRADDSLSMHNSIRPYFQLQKYEFVCGDPDTVLSIEEDKCHFTFKLDQYYYDSSLQSERDRLFTYFDQNDVICSLFPNMIMVIRMAKLGLKVLLNLQDNKVLKDVVVKNMKENTIDDKNLEIFSLDTFSFLKTALSTSEKNEKECPRHIYIGRFLTNLSFIRCFIGLANAFPLSSSLKDEKHSLYVYFYYILDAKNTKNKIKDHMLEVLNCNQKEALFDKTDIEEIHIINHFNSDSKRLLMIKLKISQKVLNDQKPLIFEILQMNEQKDNGKKVSVSKRSASKDLKEETEKEIEKEVLERRSPRKKGATPSKILHTEKK